MAHQTNLIGSNTSACVPVAHDQAVTGNAAATEQKFDSSLESLPFQGGILNGCNLVLPDSIDPERSSIGTAPTAFPQENRTGTTASDAEEGQEEVALGTYVSDHQERNEFRADYSGAPDVTPGQPGLGNSSAGQSGGATAVPALEELSRYPMSDDIDVTDADAAVQSLVAQDREEDIIALGLYSGSAFKGMNKALRGTGLPEGVTQEEALRAYESIIKASASGLSALPNHEGVVYRGIDADAWKKYGTAYVPGATVVEKGFMSTSTEAGASLSFSGLEMLEEDEEGPTGPPTPGGALFVIQSRTGKDISSFANISDEEEVLFAPGSQFRVVSQEFDEQWGVTVVFMDQL